MVDGEPWRRKARLFLRDAIAAGVTLIAPPLWEYETESVLQGLLQAGVLTISQTDAALARLATIGVQILAPTDLVKRARAIARQSGQSKIYDSLYAALADVRGCELWTADKAFFDAVKSALPFVKYLPAYR